MNTDELVRRLKLVDTPFIYYPSSLDTVNFTSGFKTSIKSQVFPTLKQYISDGKEFVVINNNTTGSAKTKGFGYLYTYSVANELSKKIPVIVSREELQKAIESNEADYYQTTDSILFVEGVSKDYDSYEKPEIRKFSNLLYERVRWGHQTVLDVSDTNFLGNGAVTPFLYSYLMSMGAFVDMNEVIK